ncbi:MAG: peptide chain release factor N(5)-glutamine methyltransferase [Treponema sp.]|nr:peptide chain release factor N(5)-glutamine methyltransferase [Treponema sp.]
MIIREALAQGSADLKYAGIETPGLDASLLLAHVLNTTRAALTARATEQLSEKTCAAFCELIERRAGGECTAYITGKKEFRGLDFLVNKSVLVPRPDTETLVEAALEVLSKINNAEAQRHKEINNPGASSEVLNLSARIKVLDLCTGSGAIAIAIKKEIPILEIYAADISIKALETAKENASRLLPNGKIDFYHGDLFDALKNPFLSSPLIHNVSVPVSEIFSLIVSNPPYIPSGEISSLPAEVQNEPRTALDGGENGLDIIKRIIENAPQYLEKDGVLLLEADPRQMKDISNLLEKHGYDNIQLFNDLSGSQRVIGGRYKK